MNHLPYHGITFNVASNQLCSCPETKLIPSMTGKQVQEKYLMPEGGLFEVVSCPHMLAEVVIYAGLLIILGPLTDWLWVALWVLSNQVSSFYLSSELLRHGLCYLPDYKLVPSLVSSFISYTVC